MGEEDRGRHINMGGQLQRADPEREDSARQIPPAQHYNLRKKLNIGSKIIFAGHVISNEGVKPDPEKLKAIKQFPRSTNVTEVQSFMGQAKQLTNCKSGYCTHGDVLTGSLAKGNGLAVDRPARGRFQTNETVAQLERNCHLISSWRPS